MVLNVWGELGRRCTEESDYYEDEYPENEEGVNGHPLSDGTTTFFDLTPVQRLDMMYVLCENKLTSGEDLGEAMEALAAVAAPTEEYEGHPEAGYAHTRNAVL